MFDIFLPLQWAIIPFFVFWAFTENFKNSFYNAAHRMHFQREGIRVMADGDKIVDVRVTNKKTMDERNRGLARTLRSRPERFYFWITNLIIYEIFVGVPAVGLQLLLQ